MIDYFVYDDIDTRNYEGVYVIFDNVDNTPKRVYEEVEIPARNGKFYIDQERYEDVEHVYHVIAMTKATGSDLINALASKVGYHRLNDSFNTDEYYEAVFSSGAEVDITADRDTNKFQITFTRKPQRFLTSGETESSVANNGTLTNPTLFESKPVLKVQGYGDIGINDDVITLQSIPVGDLLLANGKNIYIQYPYSGAPLPSNYIGSQIIDSNKLATGDSITINPSTFTYTMTTSESTYFFWQADAESQTGTGINTEASYSEKSATWKTIFEPINFVKGTASTKTHTYKLKFGYGDEPGYGVSGTRNITIEISYDGANEISMYATKQVHTIKETMSGEAFLNDVEAYSTVQISGVITVDLNVGSAFWNNSGTIMDANNAVSLGAKIPTLKKGTNTFTYSNTFTSFKVQPNWWKL